jgi:hypothetical protein
VTMVTSAARSWTYGYSILNSVFLITRCQNQ